MGKPLKEIYIVKVDGQPAAFGCIQGNPHYFYSFCPKGKYKSWVKSLKEDFPEFRLRCIRNDGVVEWLRKRKTLTEIKSKDIINNR